MRHVIYGAKRSVDLRTGPEITGAAYPLPDLRLELTEQDPYNNVIRTTIEALAARWAVLSHCIPTPLTKRLVCLRFLSTHCPQHPDHHPGRIRICRTVDPLAGSYYIESLTDQSSNKPELLSNRSTKPVAWRNDRSRSAKTNDRRGLSARTVVIDQGKRVIVGVNKYKLDHETKPMYLRSTT